MQTETLDIKARIAQLRARYTRLALQCRAAGLRVNAQTIAEYTKEIQALQSQLA